MTTAPAAATGTRPLKVAVIGNPNTGKSTLFNALAGLHAHVGNYPGVTVEKKIGHLQWGDRRVELIDLPGTYSLCPRSYDEVVAVNVLLGRQSDVGPLDAVICIADASNLERHLFLLGQILDIGVPTVLVLNMWDTARAHGLAIDVDELSRRIKVPVVTTEAHRRKGIDGIQGAVEQVIATTVPQPPRLFPQAFYDECAALEQQLAQHGARDIPWFLRERMLLDEVGVIERQAVEEVDPQVAFWLAGARRRLTEAGIRLPLMEAEARYRWAREQLHGVVEAPAEPVASWTDRLDRLLTHRACGLLIFAGLMFVVFQAIYTWAGPLMDLCEAGQELLSGTVASVVPPGPLRSLLVDGVIAGVGGVLVFLPQIMLLFLFIALLEDCGYMARGAYMMDRVMATFGLSGKSFLPLMSSFACAIPGIMATRVIENYRDRMVTILVAPLMSCSARLPVYLLLIAAFIPATGYIGGWVSLQGLVLFAMSSIGLLVAIPVAWLLKRYMFPGAPAAFVMELPEYKVPSFRLVTYRVYERGLAFVSRAGTLIFATTLLVWAAGYFPGDHTRHHELEARIEQLEAALPAPATSETDEGGTVDVEAHEPPELAQLREELNLESATLIRESFLGKAGHFIEPVVKPLGWDWRIGVGALASFPAREVIISTLGTIYSLGGDVDEESTSLRDTLKRATWPDGRPIYSIPVALSLMVFFALCAQCAATLMVMRRETNSWRWPLFSFTYMTALAYIGALLTYQIGSRL
ncbi:MAG: ferrous iron transport protein B [Planctomycetaceae bacterium]